MVKKKTVKRQGRKVPEYVGRKPAMNHWQYVSTGKIPGKIGVPEKLKRSARQLDKMGYRTQVWWDPRNEIWWLYRSRKKRR